MSSNPIENGQSVNETDISKGSMPSSESPYVPTSFGSQDHTASKTDIPVVSPPANLDNEINLTPASVTIESKSGKSGFKWFVIFGLLIILIIYGFVAYEYFKNKSLKETAGADTNASGDKSLPTPSFDPRYVLIENGSIVYKTNDTNKTLVDKNSFPTTGITGFSRVVVSPDNLRLCFESVPPSTKPALFVADSTGTNSRQISANKSSCLWRKDGNIVYYIGKEQGLANINIYEYDLTKSLENNLTRSAFASSNPDFTIVGLSTDETKLICSYNDPSTDQVQRCEIDLLTLGFSVL